jgi:hypothetical protein
VIVDLKTFLPIFTALKLKNLVPAENRNRFLLSNNNIDIFSSAEELMNTRIDPEILKRTVRQQVRRSPEPAYLDRRPLFTVRPIENEIFDRRPIQSSSFTTVPPMSLSRRHDYDDVYLQQEREDEMYRRRLYLEEQAAAQQVMEEP